jgi:opacity protein-like surface antigen
MEEPMRRALTILSLVLLAAAWAQPSVAGNLDVRVGAFFPRADSNLFHEDTDLYLRDGSRVDKSDWIGWAGGVSYNAKIANNLEFGVDLDGYGKTLHTSYAGYVDGDTGGEIRQDLELDMVPLGVSLRVVPTGRLVRFAPFAEVGAGVMFYEYKEVGDFVDFYSPDCDTRRGCPVYPDAFKSDGAAFALHVGGGIRVAVSDDVSVVGQYRYYFAGRKDMGEDFSGLQVDLNGGMATFGFNIRF